MSARLNFHLYSNRTAIYQNDANGNLYQFFLNLPFGANERKSHAVFLEVCERSSFAEQRRNGSFNNPYKFNDYGGKSFKKAFDEHTARSAELDEETGLYYYGARYYNPRTSVFISVDPLTEQTMTPYQYTYQNPVRYIDPTGMAAEEVDDIIIRGKNNSSLTLKTSINLEFESSIDFKGNHTLLDLSNIAIGYEKGVNATGAAAVGTSYNNSFISVLFFGGDYSGYWYDYVGGEVQGVLNSSAEGTVGTHKNWFIAFNDNKSNRGLKNTNTPKGFAGNYFGGGGALGGKLGGIGVTFNGSISISEDQTWQILSLGASATIGPQIGLFFGGAVGAEGHMGTTRLLNKPIPTENRSKLDKISNWILHLIN